MRDVIKESQKLNELPLEVEMLLKLYVYGTVQMAYKRYACTA